MTKTWMQVGLALALTGCGARYGRSSDVALETVAEAPSRDSAGAMASYEATEVASAPGEASPAPPSAARPASGSMASAGEAVDGAAAPASSMSVDADVSGSTTVTVTVTEEAPAVAPVQQAPVVQRMLTAASVGDHDRRGNYLEFTRRHRYEGQRLGLDLSRRIRIRVIDHQGQGVNDAQIAIEELGVHGVTHADGGWDFFPSVSVPSARGATRVIVRALGRVFEAQIHVPGAGDGQDLVVRLPVVQSHPPRALDLAFAIDVTGSMEDELRYINHEVGDIVARVRSEVPEADVRVGAVFYRDRTDPVAVQMISFTEDVAGFAQAMRDVHASGGGDYPEDMNAGLAAAFDRLAWRQGNAVRVLAVVADAPPKRYSSQFTYREAMLEASRRGVRLLPVAASGADREVEYLFRAMGAFTSTPYVYLTDDSGIGNPHLEADTDRVAVEYFNDLLTRLVVDDLNGRGMHEPGAFGTGAM